MFFILNIFSFINDYNHQDTVQNISQNTNPMVIKKYFSPSYYAGQYGISEKKALSHYIYKGWKLGYQPNAWFDSKAYSDYFKCKTNPFVDWLAQKSGVKEHSKKYIVSLTTFPPRIHTAWFAIESLLRQTIKPDMVVLYLAKSEFPGQVLPPQYDILKKRGLSIKWVDHNIMSHKKWLYTVLSYPKDYCVTADDDFIYGKDWLKTLINYKGKDRAVLPTRVDIYKDYHFVSGYGGLFPCQKLHNFIKNNMELINLSPLSDDTLLSTLFQNVIKNNVKINRKYLVSKNRRISNESKESIASHGNEIKNFFRSQVKNYLIPQYKEIKFSTRDDELFLRREEFNEKLSKLLSSKLGHYPLLSLEDQQHILQTWSKS